MNGKEIANIDSDEEFYNMVLGGVLVLRDAIRYRRDARKMPFSSYHMEHALNLAWSIGYGIIMDAEEKDQAQKETKAAADNCASTAAPLGEVPPGVNH